MAATLDEIKKLIDELRRDIIEYVNTRISAAKQIRTVAGLSDISERLGLIRSGEFRSGNNKEPGYGFSGVRIAYPPMTYNEDQWNIAGVENDKLQFGLSSETGAASFGGGNITMDRSGMVQTGFGILTEFQSRNNDNYLSFMGGIVLPTGKRVQGQHMANIGDVIFSDGFESGYGASWGVDNGSPEVIDTDSYSGSKCLYLDAARVDRAALTLTTISGFPYVLKFKIKSNVNDASLYTYGYGSPATAYLNVPVKDVWTNLVVFFIASGTTTTIGFSAYSTASFKIDDVEITGAYTISSYGQNIDETTEIVNYTYHNTPNSAYGVGISPWLTLNKTTATPTHTTSVATRAGIYLKGNLLIIAYNDSGTVRYKYLDLSGTGVTWVHTTTPP